MRRIYGTHTCFTVSRFSLQTGEPQINISSIPPSNKLSIGAALYLTCIAWQTNELPQDPKTRPKKIEWFDPQDKLIKPECQQPGNPPAKSVMNCSLEVETLTGGKLGNYTCKASNSYYRCSNKIFQVDRQQGKSKNRNVKMPARRVEKVSEYFIATVCISNQMVTSEIRK